MSDFNENYNYGHQTGLNNGTWEAAAGVQQRRLEERMHLPLVADPGPPRPPATAGSMIRSWAIFFALVGAGYAWLYLGLASFGGVAPWALSGAVAGAAFGIALWILAKMLKYLVWGALILGGLYLVAQLY